MASLKSIDEETDDEKVQEAIVKKDWMLKKRLELIDTLDALDKFLEEALEVGLCVVDLETNGLNVGPSGRGKGTKDTMIAGFCLSYHEDYGVYVPVYHTEGKCLPLLAVLERIKKLVAGCVTIYHNFKFDGELLRMHGIIIEDSSMYHDTMLMCAVTEANLLSKRLKDLSKGKLNQEQLELEDVVSDKRNKDFSLVHPKNGMWYGASDGVCTMGLYNHYKALMEEMDPEHNNGIFFIYDVERNCQLVVMEMERNLVKIDVSYYEKLNVIIEKRLVELELEIDKAAGRSFDHNSAQQLGSILFDELGLPYPSKDKTRTGQYQVKDEILEKIKDKHPLPRLIQELRELGKIHGTYVLNLLKNVDENSCIKFQLNQSAADTGRFSSKGGSGLLMDGYSGVNCQNIPAASDKDPWKLRQGIVARPGYKICSIDYSGEELRIAANFSKEPVWLEEFNTRTGDLHSITASLLFGGIPADYTDENKPELTKKRKIAKIVNFLILYGGGPARFAAAAKISVTEAAERLEKFFEGLPKLAEWLKVEKIKARKRGYARTAFGRRLPLKEMYDSGDRELIGKADRLACNAAIQGCLQKSCRMLTNKGYLQIGDLFKRGQTGEQFKVWTGHTWAPFHTLNRGECEVAEIRLANGHRIDCDTRHQVLVVGDKDYVFKHYDDLGAEDQVCMSPISVKEFGEYPAKFESTEGSHNKKSIVIQDSTSLWDEIAWLSGVVIGDGWVRFTDKPSVSLGFGANKLVTILPRVKTLANALGVVVSEPRVIKGANGESYEVCINSKALVELMEFMGHEPATSRTKRIPYKIWESPLSMRKAFLRGYWDTDGSKKRVNRYSFHTPNYELLRDVAILGRSLGLDSRILATNANTYRLDWSDLCVFEKTMGLPVSASPYRAMGKDCVVPTFMVPKCIETLSSVYDKAHAGERALVSKLKTGKRVLIKSVEDMCSKHGVVPPAMYYTSNFKSKKNLGRKETTYTLSVQDDGHRFDGDGVIHKNTGADVIKIAMFRVWSYIRKNNLQDDVRMLIPIHDEIVYEIREDKLDTLVPALCQVMKIRDLTDSLKWPVKLEVDAEYGDNFMVSNNYYKDLAKGITPSIKMGLAMAAKEEEEPEAVVPAPVPETEPVTADNVQVLPPLEDLPPPKPIKEIPQPPTAPVNPPKVLDSSEFYNYEVQNKGELAELHTDMTWCILRKMDEHMTGPRKRIRLTRDKKVIYTTPVAYSVDGFLALAYNYIL